MDNDHVFPKESFGSETFDDRKFSGNIDFSHVAFSYDKDYMVLKDVSFSINAGDTVAFVGQSGSGKTTIFNLVSKLYIVDGGKILLDGKDINTLSKTAIRDNLRIVKSDLTDEEMIHACKLVCLHDDIMRMEKGYDSVLGEAGITLSGGQRQRLAIARAFLKDCSVILLDEATSALDNISQQKVQDAYITLKDTVQKNQER